MGSRLGNCMLALTLCTVAFPQVIEYEANGLRYQALTRNGVTVMFAQLPAHLRDFGIVQAAVSNGSGAPYTVKAEDFSFERSDGTVIRATPAKTVVAMLIEKGGRNEVIKLVSAYESALYGMSRMRPTNGYEARRQQYLAEVSSTKLKAAAAASAIAFVQTRLAPGQSTDGAVFFPLDRKPFGLGRMVVRTNTDLFEFKAE